ncbi:MAG: dephospho-CoA kinase [Rhodobacteraceae bacterium]|nr:dephospho-CoA kinase [Paracoccaceae bacterium]
MTRPFLLGLTGSIGMGKSTTSAMFRDAGIPVWDADATVHRLYSANGEAVTGISEICPEAIRSDAVDRNVLSRCIADDPGLLGRIEAIVHPLTAVDRNRFIADAGERGDPLVVLDIPLLFETGADRFVDAIVVVSAPKEVQRKRVLDRPGMTEEKFRAILGRQLPDDEKRRKANYVIETHSLDQTRMAVQNLIDTILAENA